MDSGMNRTQLAQKRYRDKVRNDQKEIRLNKKKYKKQKKVKKLITIIIINYKKQKDYKITKEKPIKDKWKKSVI